MGTSGDNNEHPEAEDVEDSFGLGKPGKEVSLRKDIGGSANPEDKTHLGAGETKAPVGEIRNGEEGNDFHELNLGQTDETVERNADQSLLGPRGSGRRRNLLQLGDGIDFGLVNEFFVYAASRFLKKEETGNEADKVDDHDNQRRKKVRIVLPLVVEQSRKKRSGERPHAPKKAQYSERFGDRFLVRNFIKNGVAYSCISIKESRQRPCNNRKGEVGRETKGEGADHTTGETHEKSRFAAPTVGNPTPKISREELAEVKARGHRPGVITDVANVRGDPEISDHKSHERIEESDGVALGEENAR